MLSLPSRIGGGLVVYIVSSNGTQLWRTKTWLDRLEPLSELRDPVDEMVAGFDRLYVRLTTGEIRAIDPDSGNQLSLGPLPPATRIRILAFADAWRAVAVVDFRGALATFDAGNTWRPVPLDGVNVNQLGVKDGDFALDTPRGRFMLSAGGELSRDEAPREGPQAPGGNEAPAKVGVLANVRPFGRRPLRAAIEDGWPLAGPGGEPAAVFAQGGAIHRVGLETGRLFETKPGAFRDDDGSCHAIALRGGFGFVCTTATAGSAIYAVEPPLVMREVARFARPRVVIASGNGGFVARGPCARDAAATDAAFCFFFPSGEEKQVSPPAGASEANADIRPVALRDGRALFVFSSAAGSGSKLFVARGGDFDAISLSDRNAVLRRAYLLEGIEERAPGILGGWALVSEELRGVRIGIDGKAEVGPASAKVDRTVVAGRFGFDWAANGRGFETVDGGMSWTPVDLAVPDLAAVPRSVASCGPVGCVRDKWLRIGWGRASEAPDLPLARTPDRSRVRLAPARDVSFRCQATGEIAGPPPPPPPKLADARPQKSKQPAAPPAGLRLFPRGPLMPLSAPPIARPAPDPRTPSVGGPSWSPFRGMPAPALAAGSIGLEAGTDPPIVMQARVYTWGPRGAEWLHSGYVQARFDDRFEFLGIRTTAATAPPWADEDRASDALGLTTGQPVNWSALLDPSGRAAVLVAQRGGGRADLYAAAAGEPLVLWRDVDNGALPAPNSVVRIGSTWFFLHSLWTSNAWSTTVYRVDGGVARRLARLPRVPVPPAEFVPKLMRRAQSKGLGILVQGAPGFDQVIRDLVRPAHRSRDGRFGRTGSTLWERLGRACTRALFPRARRLDGQHRAHPLPADRSRGLSSGVQPVVHRAAASTRSRYRLRRCHRSAHRRPPIRCRYSIVAGRLGRRGHPDGRDGDLLRSQVASQVYSLEFSVRSKASGMSQTGDFLPTALSMFQDRNGCLQNPILTVGFHVRGSWYIQCLGWGSPREVRPSPPPAPLRGHFFVSRQRREEVRRSVSPGATLECRHSRELRSASKRP